MVYPYSFLRRQRENWRLAEEWTPRVRAKVQEAGLEDIQVCPFTARGGCLLVMGSVRDELAALRVREAVESTSPCMPVFYSITIEAPVREEGEDP